MRISVPVEFVPTQSVWWIDRSNTPPNIYPARVTCVTARTSDSMCLDVFVEYNVVIFEKERGAKALYAQKWVPADDLRNSRGEAVDEAIEICNKIKKARTAAIDDRIKELKQMKG